MKAFVAQIESTKKTGTVVLPEQLPPDLLDAWMTRSGDVSTLNFYSHGAPIVMVCSGDAGGCRDRAPDFEEVRTERVDDEDVVVLLGRSDDPAGDDPLPHELRTFWSDIEFTTADPPWLRTS